MGWRIEDETRRRSLAKGVLSASGWNASPDEDYEPDDDPAEFIAHLVIESPSRALLEKQLRWATHLAEEFGATLPRLGLGAA